jgi:hypothetical protein
MSKPYPGLFGWLHESVAIAETLKVSTEEAFELQRALGAERCRPDEPAVETNVIPFPMDRVRE